MEVYVIHFYKNDGWGLRFDNYEYCTSFQIVTKLSEAKGIAFEYCGLEPVYNHKLKYWNCDGHEVNAKIHKAELNTDFIKL